MFQNLLFCLEDIVPHISCHRAKGKRLFHSCCFPAIRPYIYGRLPKSRFQFQLSCFPPNPRHTHFRHSKCIYLKLFEKSKSLPSALFFAFRVKTLVLAPIDPSLHSHSILQVVFPYPLVLRPVRMQVLSVSV